MELADEDLKTTITNTLKVVKENMNIKERLWKILTADQLGGRN